MTKTKEKPKPKRRTLVLTNLKTGRLQHVSPTGPEVADAEFAKSIEQSLALQTQLGIPEEHALRIMNHLKKLEATWSFYQPEDFKLKGDL